MNFRSFEESLKLAMPPSGLSAPLEALWWDAKGDWSKAHQFVDELETKEAMPVHAYLHRKEGEQWNAHYWYQKAGIPPCKEDLEIERDALVDALLLKNL